MLCFSPLLEKAIVACLHALCLYCVDACVLKQFVCIDYMVFLLVFVNIMFPFSCLQKNIVHRDLKLGNMVLNKR